MNNKTILITGISGFIAKHCAIELLRQGYCVRGTVRSMSKAEEVKAKAAEAVKTEGEQLAKAQDSVAQRHIKEQKAKGVTVKPTPIAAAAPAPAAAGKPAAAPAPAAAAAPAKK